MNTLPRAITARILADPKHYYSLRQHWSVLMCSPRKHTLAAAHHLVYLALIGKDWRNGFTPVTNPRKLANGAFNNWGLFKALVALHLPSREAEILTMFDGLVTPLMLQQVRKLVPIQRAYSYRPEQFNRVVFPFDAYSPLAEETSEATPD